MRRALLCLAFALGGVVYAQVPQISLGTQTLLPDGTTSIAVQLSSSGNSPAAIQFDVTYDNTLGSIAINADAGATAASKSIHTAGLQVNQTRVIVVDQNQNTIPDGTVVTLIVTPVAQGGTGPYTIAFSNFVASDATGGSLIPIPQGGGGPPPPPPPSLPFGIVNAASEASGAIAPGEIVSLYFGGLVPSFAAASDLSVTIDGTAAPMLYADPNQINAVTPFGLAGKSSVQVALNYQGQAVAQGTVSVAATAPGIFSANGLGQGQGAIVNQDTSLNSASNPAPVGSTVTLFATGAGSMNPPLTDGEIVASSPTPTSQPVASVQLSMCGADIRPNSIPYAGPAPGEIAGILQVNFVIPQTCATSTGPAVPLVMFIGGNKSQSNLTIAIQ
ncbi:MAG TPA: hypothetical protein VH639_29495 [Bryobacteraceae bacterium]|jgi:uncharacterized protein (TIGR03437 family)